jgi:hypothetical protein
MKHKKGQCAIFIESRLPCEDCDLEGHSATCGWHIDWHSCSCEAFDKKGIKMKSYELVDGKLIIRDPEIIQKLDHLSEEELKEVAEIMRKDLDEMKNKDESK